jgi:hypothetical protein
MAASLLAEIMLVDNATFHLWTMLVYHTCGFLQAKTIQCFSEVMARLWRAEKMIMDNATFHPWPLKLATFPTPSPKGLTWCCNLKRNISQMVSFCHFDLRNMLKFVY